MIFSLLAALPKVAYYLRGSLLRGLVVLAGGSCGPGLRVERGFRMRQKLHPGLQFGARVYFGKDVTIDCLEGGTLRIGDHAAFTQGNFISCCKSVEIGAHALIGEYTSIRDANHGHSDLDLPIAGQPMVAKPVVIGPNTWIGRGCAILSGATIGEGAIVGANSIVVKDVPSRTIAVGSPARPVRSRAAP